VIEVLEQINRDYQESQKSPTSPPKKGKVGNHTTDRVKHEQKAHSARPSVQTDGTDMPDKGKLCQGEQTGFQPSRTGMTGIRQIEALASAPGPIELVVRQKRTSQKRGPKPVASRTMKGAEGRKPDPNSKHKTCPGCGIRKGWRDGLCRVCWEGEQHREL
jgi:hypothetical protein